MKENQLKLNLRENAFDYLAASLEYVHREKSQKSRVVWKFALLNLTFAIELFLKARLQKENYLLVYENLEKFKPITRETKTVSSNVLVERVKFILGPDFDKGRLRLAQTIRNQMLHYDVKLEFPTVYHDYANLLNFATDFFNKELREDEEDELQDHLPNELVMELRDLTAAFSTEIVYYNQIFMPVHQQRFIEDEQQHTILLVGTEKYTRIPYGAIEEDQNASSHSTSEPCHDCYVRAGQIHVLGCIMETCPKCKHQMISCVCGEGLPIYGN